MRGRERVKIEGVVNTQGYSMRVIRDDGTALELDASFEGNVLVSSPSAPISNAEALLEGYLRSTFAHCAYYERHCKMGMKDE
jgi:hypothetical protein